MNLNNKVAVITGGVSGIGQATAQALAKEQVRAIGIVDFSDNTEAVCESMNAAMGRDVMVAFQGDVVSGEFRERVFQTLESRFVPIVACVRV